MTGVSFRSRSWAASSSSSRWSSSHCACPFSTRLSRATMSSTSPRPPTRKSSRCIPSTPVRLHGPRHRHAWPIASAAQRVVPRATACPGQERCGNSLPCRLHCVFADGRLQRARARPPFQPAPAAGDAAFLRHPYVRYQWNLARSGFTLRRALAPLHGALRCRRGSQFDLIARSLLPSRWR